jgi:3-deoxy-manno-octulosonate cytidylyltransferase (CMP-KDO synthetase)
MKTIGVIPCRYQSSRFPGKSLALINEKPMMWHVYQRVLESKVCDEIYIATDDERIKNVCNELGIESIMTRSDHQTGTDRVAEAANTLKGDYYINIQGDEPCIDPEAIRAVALGIINCQDESVVASNG